MSDAYRDIANQSAFYGIGSLMTGFDQQQRAYELLQGGLDVFYADYQTSWADRERFYDIWDQVERAEADQIMSDLGTYSDYNRKLMDYNLEAMNRSKLYYPLEEASIQAGLEELGFEKEQRERIQSILWPYEDKAMESATKDLEEQEQVRQMRQEMAYPAMREYADEIQKITPESYADRAGADVEHAYASQQDQLNRNFSRMGVNPNSGAAAQAMADVAGQKTLDVAGARNTGYRQGEEAKRTGLGQLVSLVGGYQPPTSTGTQMVSQFGTKSAGNAGLSVAAGGGLKTGLTSIMSPKTSSTSANLSNSWRTQAGQYPSYSPMLSASQQSMGRFMDGVSGWSDATAASDAQDSSGSGWQIAGGIANLGLSALGTAGKLGWL